MAILVSSAPNSRLTDPLNSHIMTPMLYAGRRMRLLMLVMMMLRIIGVSLMRDI